MLSAAVTLAEPFVSLRPDEGPVDAGVEVFGSGFSPGTAILIEYDTRVLDSLEVAGNGEFRWRIRVPESPAGEHVISVARASDGAELARALYTVRPRLLLRPSQGQSGRVVLAEGSGFAAGVGISFSWASGVGAQVEVKGSGVVSTDMTGSFGAAIALAAEATGEAQVMVAATDERGNSAQASYTVVPAPGQTGEDFPVPSSRSRNLVMDSLFWAAVSLAALLVAAVIVLIIRTRSV
jgi:hypothetical protein